MLKTPASEQPDTEPKRPAHQSVYEMLRDQILFGDLTPGQPVTIQGVASALNAGMTPVREAIRRLISEGALNMKGNRRIVVPPMTESCIDQLDFMRKKLEPELARRAVDHVLPEAIDGLRQRDDKLNEAISQGNIPAYLTHNYHFHATIYELAAAPIVAATVDRLWLRFGPSLRVVCGRSGTLNLPDKHADLLLALEHRDHAGAARAMEADVAQGMLQIREALRSSRLSN